MIIFPEYLLANFQEYTCSFCTSYLLVWNSVLVVAHFFDFHGVWITKRVF